MARYGHIALTDSHGNIHYYNNHIVPSGYVDRNKDGYLESSSWAHYYLEAWHGGGTQYYSEIPEGFQDQNGDNIYHQPGHGFVWDHNLIYIPFWNYGRISDIERKNGVRYHDPDGDGVFTLAPPPPPKAKLSPLHPAGTLSSNPNQNQASLSEEKLPEPHTGSSPLELIQLQSSLSIKPVNIPSAVPRVRGHNTSSSSGVSGVSTDSNAAQGLRPSSDELQFDLSIHDINIDEDQYEQIFQGNINNDSAIESSEDHATSYSSESSEETSDQGEASEYSTEEEGAAADSEPNWEVQSARPRTPHLRYRQNHNPVDSESEDEGPSATSTPRKGTNRDMNNRAEYSSEEEESSLSDSEADYESQGARPRTQDRPQNRPNTTREYDADSESSLSDYEEPDPKNAYTYNRGPQNVEDEVSWDNEVTSYGADEASWESDAGGYDAEAEDEVSWGNEAASYGAEAEETTSLTTTLVSIITLGA